MDLIDSWLSPALIAVVLAILMIGSWWLGIRLGRRSRAANRAAPQFDGPSMALLSLLLAFAFGTSMSKHDQRRVAVVQDANAIGDFYTCATLLKEPTRTRLQAAIRGYAIRRLTVASGPLSNEALEDALKEFQRMHGQMTALVNQALDDGTPIAVSLTNTLNAVTGNQASRLAAIRDRLASSIVALLCISSIVTTILLGRTQGFSGDSDLAGAFCFVLLVSFTIFVTIDLNQPEAGFIKVSQEPISRLVWSMGNDVFPGAAAVP